jgi:hypothetical protein
MSKLDDDALYQNNAQTNLAKNYDGELWLENRRLTIENNKLKFQYKKAFSTIKDILEELEELSK